MDSRIAAIEQSIYQSKPVQGINVASCPLPKNTEAKSAADDGDDVDLFGSDSEEENDAAAKVREERLAAYAAKKSKSKSVPVLIYPTSLGQTQSVKLFSFRACADSQIQRNFGY